jgi:hypothetical protein
MNRADEGKHDPPDELYEKVHPETKKGGAPGKAGGGKKAKTAKLATLARDTATKTGLSRR